MPAVCFYFQVHQPFRIRRFRFAEVGLRHSYFDDAKNALILDKVARKSYLKTNQLLCEMMEQYGSKFRVSFSISGVALEQMRLYAPEVLQSFQRLVAKGQVELLSETYHHSLASLYDCEEFVAEVDLHRQAIRQHFEIEPEVFRNTELIYSDEIGRMVNDLGFRAVLAEGADDILAWRSPCYLYRHPDRDLAILTKHYRLSDDIAFRFSNRAWESFPLLAETFASWIHRNSGSGDVVNLFMDYETFGEHQWEETGIFSFFRQLPAEILKRPDWEFLTPSEVLAKVPVRAALSFPRIVSWADKERDVSAWVGNEMQQRALREVYALREQVFKRNNAAILRTWRRLLTSDHFYYMCTKFFSDGDVHAYFSPFKSPYQAFLSYMAILEDFRLYLITKNLRKSEVTF